MTVRMTGSEFNAFMAWPRWEKDDLFWDETRFRLNGVEVDDLPDRVADKDEIEIVAGLVMGLDSDFSMKAVEFARAFLKERSIVSILIEVPKAQQAAVLAALADLRRTLPKLRVL